MVGNQRFFPLKSSETLEITLICDKSGDDIMEFHRDFCMLLRIKSVLNDPIKIIDGVIIFIAVMKEVY